MMKIIMPFLLKIVTPLTKPVRYTESVTVMTADVSNCRVSICRSLTQSMKLFQNRFERLLILKRSLRVCWKAL